MEPDLSDPRAVADELDRLASATHIGGTARRAMAAGARTIRKLLGDKVAPVPPTPTGPPSPPKRAV